MTLLDLCSYLGLGAAGAASLNLLLGLLISLRYSPLRHWPHWRLNIFAFHQWMAYCTIVLTLTHPLVLLFLDKPHFRVFDILLPIQSPLQPLINVAGAAAMYLLLLVFVTSLFRSRIGRPLWRRIHYLVFPCRRVSSPSQLPYRSRPEGWPSRPAGWRQSLCRDSCAYLLSRRRVSHSSSGPGTARHRWPHQGGCCWLADRKLIAAHASQSGKSFASSFSKQGVGHCN